MSQVLRARAIGMLAGRMSTRAVNRELNFHFLPVSRLQRCFREFGSASNQPHNHRPRATTPAQDLHIRPVHRHDRLRPNTRTAAAVIGLQNHRISARTVRNHFWGVCLHAQQPHRALELTADGKRSHSMTSCTLERCFLNGWVTVSTVQDRWQTVFIFLFSIRIQCIAMAAASICCGECKKTVTEFMCSLWP